MTVASVAPGSNQGKDCFALSGERLIDLKISLGTSLLLLPMNIIIKVTLGRHFYGL